jgi:hypothetical protein
MEAFSAVRSILDLFDRHYVIVKPEGTWTALSKLLEEAALNPWMPLTNDLLQGYQVTADQLSNRLLREEPFILTAATSSRCSQPRRSLRYMMICDSSSPGSQYQLSFTDLYDCQCSKVPFPRAYQMRYELPLAIAIAQAVATKLCCRRWVEHCAVVL